MADPNDPRVIAQWRRHTAADGGPRPVGCPATNASGLCTCHPDPVDETAVWQGRARMAADRRAAGVMLDPYDRQALDRYPQETPE